MSGDAAAVVSLFGGPGGWCQGARTVGIDPIGIEIDADACATRAAAGLATIRADLLHPLCGEGFTLPPGRLLDGLIASPPCPLFSAAGNGRGRDLLPAIVNQFNRWGPWIFYDDRTEWPDDVRLLATPAEWIDQHRPKWVALEQVPAVLPYWQAVARWMHTECGYYTWAGILCAADYGVPQQRYRAFLFASLERPSHPPAPTHAEHPQGTLFGPDQARWVTMAEALGIEGTLHTNRDQRPDGSRQTRSSTRPAPTLTSAALRAQWNWVFHRPATTVQGDTRVWPPGHKINQSDIDRLGGDEARRRYGDRAGSQAVKVAPWQAGVLQGFPADYPWQGTKTSQAQQLGNAVPPPLAAHLIAALATTTKLAAPDDAVDLEALEMAA